jgi:PBP1b-binding outer membrane lipoprotein LpoB
MSKTKKALFVAFVISLSAIMLLLSGCGAAPKTTVEPTVTRAPEPVVEVADEPDVDITYTMAPDLNGDGQQDVSFSPMRNHHYFDTVRPCHERFSRH